MLLTRLSHEYNRAYASAAEITRRFVRQVGPKEPSPKADKEGYGAKGQPGKEGHSDKTPYARPFLHFVDESSGSRREGFLEIPWGEVDEVFVEGRNAVGKDSI